MKNKKKFSLTGFGIGAVAVMLVGMVVRFYLKPSEDPFYIRLLTGGEAILFTIFGAGILGLAILAVLYCAIQASHLIYHDVNEKDMTDSLLKIGIPISIVSFVASYIVIMVMDVIP